MGSASSRHACPTRRKEDQQRRKMHNFVLSCLRSFSCGASSSCRVQERELEDAAHFSSPGVLICGNKSDITLKAGVPCETAASLGVSEAVSKREKRIQSESLIASSNNIPAVSVKDVQCDISKHTVSSSTSLYSKSESSLESAEKEVNYEVINGMQLQPVCENSRIISDETTSEYESFIKYDAPLQQDDASAGPAGVLVTVCSEANPSRMYSMSQVVDSAGVSFSGNRVSGESSVSLHDDSLPSLQSVSEQVPKGESLVSEQLSSRNNTIVNSALSSAENVGGVVHVEAFSLIAESEEASSSSHGVISVREERHNNRRRLWDALTMATSRRRTSGDADSLGSSNDTRSLFEWGNEPDESSGDSDHPFVGRSLETEERRWRVRSQVWSLHHLSSGFDGGSGHLRSCATGVHADGRCTCQNYAMPEESNTRASISRIVMLAEALFEVLDEIHRQSVALSRSTLFSLVSLPAPDSVVNSFPLRIHKSSNKPQNDDEEATHCYICLVEYVDGDYVRVLPCKHEYHMTCVDKWLKEAHRVCPLCRDNVCEPGPRNAGSMIA